jgi:hypothetical protein
VFLILVGIGFLLVRTGLIDVRWHAWWPMILIMLGFAWIVVPGRPRQVASGITFVFIGLWFFACMEHWYGLTYRTAWPLFVVFAGIEMVVTSVLERIWPDWKKEKEEHHA